MMKFETVPLRRLKHSNILILCLFLLLGLAIYWNSFGNSFQYDDEVVVKYNRNIRTLKNIPYFFIKPAMLSADPHIAKHYRPIVVMSYAINYAIGGLNPVGYHLVNLAFHIGSAFMIFLIVKTMLGGGDRGRFFASLAAGLIFLVHPFNSEAVNYTTARFSIMSSFFYLLGFWCWVKFRSKKQEARSKKIEVRSQKSEDRSKMGFSNFLPLASYFYIASLLAFVAGMMSKEVVITLPIVLWLYDIYFQGIWRRMLDWRTYVPYLPFIFIIGISYWIIRAASFEGGNLPPFQRDVGTQIYTGLPILVKHWQMFLIPAQLTPFHYVEIYNSFYVFNVVFSTLILFFYIIIAILFARLLFSPWRVVSFFMIWFFIVLLPSTIIPLNAIFQENRGYLAIVSFAVMTGVFVGRLPKIRIKRGTVAILAILVLTYSVITIQRNRVWKDELTLWKDASQKAPLSPQIYTALGIAYKRAGMYNEAIDASRKALLIGGQNNFFAHDNLGRVYMVLEEWDLAAKELEMAVHGYPYKSQTHNDLGLSYLMLDRLDLAEKHLKEAIRLERESYKPYFNLGLLYAKQGRLKDAVQSYQKVLLLNPEYQRARLKLGMVLEILGRKEEAAGYYRQLLQQDGEREEILVREAQERLKRMGD